MIRVHDYKCRSCGNVTESFEKLDVMAISCPSCGTEADRQLAAPKSRLEGWSGSFPSAAMKWTRDHIERAKPKKQD